MWLNFPTLKKNSWKYDGNGFYGFTSFHPLGYFLEEEPIVFSGGKNYHERRNQTISLARYSAGPDRKRPGNFVYNHTGRVARPSLA
jgi:hypothetical protein